MWQGAEPTFFKENPSNPWPAASFSLTKDSLRLAARHGTLAAAPADVRVVGALDVLDVADADAVTVVVAWECAVPGVVAE